MSVWLERTDDRADVRKRDARLIVDAACWRDWELSSVPEKRRAFDLMLIMAGTSHSAMGVAPCMVLHRI